MPEQSSSHDEELPAYEGHAPNPFAFLDPESRGLQDTFDRRSGHASAQGAGDVPPPAYHGSPNPLTFLDPDSRARQAEIQRGLVSPPPEYRGAPNPIAFLQADSRGRQDEVASGQVGQVAYSQWQNNPETQELIARYAQADAAAQQPARRREEQGTSSSRRSEHRGSRSGKRRR